MNISSEILTFRESATRKAVAENVHVIVYLCILSAIGIIGNSMVVDLYIHQRKRLLSSCFILILGITDLLICFIVMPMRVVIFLEKPSFSVCGLLEATDYLFQFYAIAFYGFIALDQYQSFCRIGQPLFTMEHLKSIIISVGIISVVLCSIVGIYGQGHIKIQDGNHTIAILMRENFPCYLTSMMNHKYRKWDERFLFYFALGIVSSLSVFFLFGLYFNIFKTLKVSDAFRARTTCIVEPLPLEEPGNSKRDKLEWGAKLDFHNNRFHEDSSNKGHDLQLKTRKLGDGEQNTNANNACKNESGVVIEQRRNSIPKDGNVKSEYVNRPSSTRNVKLLSKHSFPDLNVRISNHSCKMESEHTISRNHAQINKLIFSADSFTKESDVIKAEHNKESTFLSINGKGEIKETEQLHVSDCQQMSRANNLQSINKMFLASQNAQQVQEDSKKECRSSSGTLMIGRNKPDGIKTPNPLSKINKPATITSRVTLRLFIVTIFHYLCWVPHIMMETGMITHGHILANIYFISNVINPFVYFATSKNFRQDFFNRFKTLPRRIRLCS